ncbi:hypothetical protein J2741_000318 [Methanolinea mesophila]|uniref:hypothetical protein n=1 Tax=Methanolinea mesophila TaxID=547055 RepID=UPI001AE67D02|nr:hypothetical protein [Methanolinea mesophila]MBP1927771.1 hypothetical protein [Methanolinea mesophila]
MKIWPFISVFFIVTLVCAPVLAISASELISSHRTGSPSSITIPKRIPSVTATATLAPQATVTPLPTQDISSIFDVFKNKGTFVMPTAKPTPNYANTQEKTYTCPPDIPVGKLYLTMVGGSCICFVGYECNCDDDKYPVGRDMLGRLFTVKDGCPVKWAEY